MTRAPTRLLCHGEGALPPTVVTGREQLLTAIRTGISDSCVRQLPDSVPSVPDVSTTSCCHVEQGDDMSKWTKFGKHHESYKHDDKYRENDRKDERGRDKGRK
jgi:hypothetical protein